jgi:hypothetical protein
VQSGFGRLGDAFWGFEGQGVVPDVVVLGKPIGNGFPLGAVVTTREIAAAFDDGMEFFSTFGGNPVSCAAGLAVLDVVEEERLQARALRVGGHLAAGLRRLQERHAVLGDVRGSGLFLGLELVRDRASLEPAAEEASYVVDRLRERGVLTGTDGPHHNVLKLRPRLLGRRRRAPPRNARRGAGGRRRAAALGLRGLPGRRGPGDDGEDLRPVALGLGGTDAVGEQQRLEARRPQQGDVAQAAVAGDDEGRDALPARQLEPQQPQRLEDGLGSGGKLSRFSRAAGSRPAGQRPRRRPRG